MTIFLVTEDYESYYFNYKSGVMRVRSSNPLFNEVIEELKEGAGTTPTTITFSPSMIAAKNMEKKITFFVFTNPLL